MIPKEGERVKVQFDGFEFDCIVRAVKTVRSFGHVRVLITPVSGSGEKWVDVKRIIQ